MRLARTRPMPVTSRSRSVDSAPWETMIVGGRPSYRTAIVKLSDRIEIDWIDARSIDTAESRDLVASWPGTIAAAFFTPPSGEPLVTVSMYAQWVRDPQSPDLSMTGRGRPIDCSASFSDPILSTVSATGTDHEEKHDPHGETSAARCGSR